MENAIIKSMPAMSIEQSVDRYNALVEFTKKVMKAGKDYGVIPGTDKPTLMKPGAEKLCTLFGFAPEFEIADKIVDFKGGLFYFQYRCMLIREGAIVATGLGSCNSMEKKYRYRNVTEKKATQEERERAIRVESKSGSYGNYKVYVLENTEPYDLINTIDKMAQKRALVAAILIGANASEFYTQDVEDMPYIEGEYREVAEEKPAPQKAEKVTPKAPVTRDEQNKVTPVPASSGHSNGDKVNYFKGNIIEQWLVEGFFDDKPNAASVFNRSPFTKGQHTLEAVNAFGRAYRAWRDSGLEADAAIEKATAGEVPA